MSTEKLSYSITKLQQMMKKGQEKERKSQKIGQKVILAILQEV